MAGFNSFGDMTVPSNAGWAGGLPNVPPLRATGGIPQPAGMNPLGNQGMASQLAGPTGLGSAMSQMGQGLGQMANQTRMDPAQLARAQALMQLMSNRPPGM
jgi:hypothetical protein